jgi:30S ribosomal protein S31
MGRGDKRTEKGKRFKGSFGNARPSKVAVKAAAPSAKKAAKPAKEKVATEEAAPKKSAAKKAPAKKAAKKTEE